MAANTKKNTRTGAIAFNAPTNKVPNMTTGFAAYGIVNAKTIPAIKPKDICFTRLI